MPRDPSITQEQVNAAADTLVADGERATARAVRDRVGGGSMGTIVALLRTWKALRSKPVASGQLSETVTKALLNYVHVEVASARAALQAKLDEAEGELDDVARELERQNAGLSARDAAIKDLEAKLAAADARAQQIGQELADARDELAQERQLAERARTDLAVAQARLEALPRLERDLGLCTAARVDAERQVAVLSTQKEALERLLANESGASRRKAGKT